MLYGANALEDGGVQLAAADIAAVRSAQPDPGAWGHWLDLALEQDDIVYFAMRAEGRLVGEIFLHDIVWERGEGMIGFHVFDPKERNRGIGRAALKLLLAWVGLETSVRRLFVITRDDNVAARRLVERAGLDCISRARENESHVVYQWRQGDA